MIQKKNIDALHKRVSHRGSLLKGVAVYRVLYQSILNAKLTGRKNLGRKRCTGNRDDRKLENTVKQSWFKHLGELHKEWTEAVVSASRVTTLRRLQEKGYQAFWTRDNIRSILPGLWRKRTGLLLSGPKSSFQMKVNFHFKVPESGGRVERHRIRRKSGEAQNPCCLKSSVKFPQSVMIWAAMSSAGVGPLCFLKSTVNAAIYQEIFRAFHASFCWQASRRCWFHFQQDLAPAHTANVPKAGSMTMVLVCLIGQQTRWPEPHRESMGYCQEEDERHQTQQCRWPEGRYQRNLGFHTTSAVPQTDHLHATLNWGSN